MASSPIILLINRIIKTIIINSMVNKISITEQFHNKLLTFRSDSFRIVYFHYSGDKIPDYHNYNSYLLTPKDLRNLLKFYKRNYKIISIQEAINRIENKKSLEKYLSITTDDGFKENYTVYAPIFIQEKIPLSIFISSNSIDNKDLLWNSKIIYINNTISKNIIRKLMEELSVRYNLSFPIKNEDLLKWSNRTWDMVNKDMYANWLWENCVPESLDSFLNNHQPYLTSSQIFELSEENELITIGSHSKSHPYFNKLKYPEYKDEIFGSIDILEKITKKSIDIFAYPYGLRPKNEYEEKLINEKQHSISTLLGIKNNLNNFADPYVWERDRQEFNYKKSLLRFSILPIIRYYLKNN